MGTGVDMGTFSLRPEHKRKFRPQQVKSLVRGILVEKLESQAYNHDTVTIVIKELADRVRDEVTQKLKYQNYKILVHCTIGEQKGEGVRIGCKCFWDSGTDNMAEEVYITKELFACVTV